MIGERIHSYEVNAHLGQGGMGNVFRATDNMLGREVALKMLHPQLTMQAQFLERFKKEARVLAQLLHPNIAVIYNFIEQDGNHFMVMEYVEGTSLDDLLKKYRVLPAEFVVPVCIQALEGLQHAHRKNIFHRDIKPANLMITNDATLKLMDFGIAKVAGEQKMTQVNKIVGTIEFMAPELIEGKDASTASDIYAMGATIYELVSGKVPFEGDTDFTLMQAILKSKVKPPEKINPAIPKALNDIIMKAMDKNPEQRYPNARAFQQALITAFPYYREIDVNVLKKAQQTVLADKLTTEQSAQRYTSPGAALETKIQLAKPLATFMHYKEKVMSHKKLLLVVLLLLFLIITIYSIKVITGSKAGETGIAQNDTLKPPVQTESNPSSDNSNTGAVSTTGHGNIDQPQQNKPDPVVTTPAEEKNDLPPQQEKPKKIIKSDPTEPKQKPVEKEEVEEPPVVKPPEKRGFYIDINSEVTVNLALASNPDVNLKPKAPQPVRFSVTRAVMYNGIVIIRQGATATGSIEIGSVMTDIEINNVEAANGQRISLRSQKAHGKRKDIESHKTYDAIIQKGTRMLF